MYPYQEVSNLRKAGQIEEAYEKAHDLLEIHPDDHYLKNALGWVLYAKIKIIAERTKENELHNESAVNEARKLLLEYANLKLPRPDLLFSLLLMQTLRISGKIYFLPEFMKWAGLESFRPEDYEADHNQEDGHIFEPLIEKAARANGKVAIDKQETDVKFAILLIDEAIKNAEIQSIHWLQYRKALLLEKLGYLDNARSILLPFVQKKRADFWAWSALSKVEEKQDPDLALVLSAKAVLTCSDEKFGVSVYEDVARIATSVGKYGLARWATDRAFTVRQENGWRIPSSLRTLIESDWYETAPTLENPSSELEICARTADQIVYKDCPRHDANFLGTFKAKSGKLMLKVAVREDGHSKEIVSPAKGLLNIENYRMGEAISIGVFDQERHTAIIEVKTRADGENFDCLDSIYGIVDHQNKEKAIASIYTPESKPCLLPYSKFDYACEWDTGSPVTVLYTCSRDRLIPYQAKIVDFQETEQIIRTSGNISIHDKGFGFVSDIYIPQRLAQSLDDGCDVSVVAVRERNKRTNKLGWRAVTATSISDA